MKRKSLVAFGLLLAAAAIGVAFWRSGGSPAPSADSSASTTRRPVPIQDVGDRAPVPVATAQDETAEDEQSEEPMTAEEKAEAEAEKLVEDFDNLTDKWTEPAKDGVKMADVDNFVAQFKKVPADRKEECLQRALNLIPDENVMLLTGILMDKTQDRELVELVFNDVLNRDEDVKQPIMRQIFKDKTHPCWADTAWILDVTGDTPAK